jgi:SAM-dependent methyltransferase
MCAGEIAQLQGVILDPALRGRVTPLFWDFFQRYATTEEGVRNYFLQSSVISRLCQINEGKEVLDIGCGFGLKLICFALIGCRKAVGIDISEEMIHGFRTLLREFPLLHIEAEKGDFLLRDYPSNSFDVVLVEEAISHIRDTEYLLDKIQYVLRTGGILYIKDSNNDMFPLSRLRSRRGWERSEHGPVPENMARCGREVDRRCFFEARIEIIHKLYPSLDDKTLKLMARKTQGMYGEQIAKAAEEFMKTGKVCQKASFLYRNPYTGEFPELGLNPFKLTKDLQGRGFECKFVPPAWAYVENISHRRWERLAISLLSPALRNCPHILLPFLGPYFCILATKR